MIVKINNLSSFNMKYGKIIDRIILLEELLV